MFVFSPFVRLHFSRDGAAAFPVRSFRLSLRQRDYFAPKNKQTKIRDDFKILFVFWSLMHETEANEWTHLKCDINKSCTTPLMEGIYNMHNIDCYCDCLVFLLLNFNDNTTNDGRDRATYRLHGNVRLLVCDKDEKKMEIKRIRITK